MAKTAPTVQMWTSNQSSIFCVNVTIRTKAENQIEDQQVGVYA